MFLTGLSERASVARHAHRLRRVADLLCGLGGDGSAARQRSVPGENCTVQPYHDTR